MQNKPWAILLIILCTFLTSSAQVFYKFAAAHLSFNLIALLTNYQLIAGILLYAIGAVLMLLAFKGGEVTVLYPIFATSFIWVTLFSQYFFGEPINAFKIIGIITIIIGISAIAYGSKNENGDF